jgi:23S rRNA (adenine1618-N6)-methyltransferase
MRANILDNVKATDVKTITMGQGQKVSRFIAWTFLSPQEQKEWSQKLQS